MTFVELLIALSVTAVVCGVMAVLISSTAAGTKSQNDGRRGLIRVQSVKSVLQDEFLNARAILATGTNYIVYWTGDQTGPAAGITPTNGAVNLGELRLLEVDTTSGNLNLYTTKYPNGWTNANILAADAAYAANSAWYNACSAAKSNYFTPTVIATGATSLATSLDNATPTSAKLVHLTITLNDGAATREVVIAAALVNPIAPW